MFFPRKSSLTDPVALCESMHCSSAIVNIRHTAGHAIVNIRHTACSHAIVKIRHTACGHAIVNIRHTACGHAIARKI